MQYFKICLFIFIPTLLLSQDFSKQWIGHYSYFKITDVFSVGSKVYTASDNAVFIYDTDTGTSKKFSSINGLSGEQISTIYHSEAYDITLLGYQNGLLELILADETRTFVDIVEKPTIPPNQKRINHFFEFQNSVYISTGFGIIAFNLEKIEFGDTFFIGSGGSQIDITATTIKENIIYASSSTNGILSANITNSNLVDFNQWTSIVPGSFNGITEFENQLLVWQENELKRLEGNILTIVASIPPTIKNVLVTDKTLTVSNVERAVVYNKDLQQVSAIASTFEDSYFLNTAVTVGDKVYLGTENRGLLEVEINNISVKTPVSPDGPIRNDVFSIEAQNDDLWVVFGRYDGNFNPFPLRKQGINKLTDGIWQRISANELLGATSLTHISIDPLNQDQVFISSFNNGLLKINDNIATNLYSSSNTGFKSLKPGEDEVRLNGSAFDIDGNLWVNSSLVDASLNRFSPNSKEVFTVDLSFANKGNLGFSDTVIDKDGNVFIGSYSSGVIGYSPKTKKIVKIVDETANMPSSFVPALEVDRNNQLWIGTLFGLRILFNPGDAIQKENPVTSNVVILDNENVPQELLFGQTITDIEVDGSNNKWIGTGASGLFYLSPDGKETLGQYTSENSPLPSNNILDISVDDSSGSVFIATEKGLLEFKGSATGPKENLDNVSAFPNPVRPNFTGRVTIKGLTAKATVKIADIEGNLVYEEVSDGGSIQWDTTAFGRHKVASGVYLILVTGDDAVETTVTKLLIVR